jgi:hypothetical protein
MNKHIEFVKEWLADNDCKTQKELEDNADAAAFFAMIGDAEKAAEHVESYEEMTK